MKTLGDALDPRRNSVNAIRLFFAVSILFLHAVTLGGYSEEMPKFGFHDTIGTYMLAGFFVISGYLITASRMGSRSFGDYMWRRVLRIYPAWICSLLFVGIVAGPLSVLIVGHGSYDWSSGLGYVWKNFFFVLKQLDVEGTLQNVPASGVWNFSAWTLFYEFSLWIGMGLLVTLWPRRHLGWGIWLGLLFFTGIKLLNLVESPDGGMFTTETHAGVNGGHHSLLVLLEPLARLGVFFMAGAVLCHHRDKIVLKPLWGWACLALSAVFAWVGVFHTFAALPFAYVVMYAGCSTRLSNVNHPDDYSYGMYIFAFPITQLWATFTLKHAMPEWLFLLACLAVTAPVAWLSWHVVEKPAMRLKRLTKGRDKPIIGVP